jgi:uncharacterized protein YbcC (UPF0753/DUF2309 family)
MPSNEDPCDDLAALVAKAAVLLPAQGPIDVFIHHNTLHAFESQPFEEAVIRAGTLFRAEPFLPESRYREELAVGRIRESDIDAVLDRQDPNHLATTIAGGRITIRELHRTLLLHAVRQESDAEVRWTLSESDVLERFRPDLPDSARRRLMADEVDHLGSGVHATVKGDSNRERQVCSDLWHACVEAVAFSRPSLVHASPPVRHRDLIRGAEPTIDTDDRVHPLLIRLSAAYLDQGIAAWPMPNREHGFLRATIGLYAEHFGPLDPWGSRLPQAFAEYRSRSAEECIRLEMQRSGVGERQQEAFIRESLLALRGWAGMFRQFEERPDRAPVTAVPARLVDFLAVRLVLDRVAAEWAATRLGIRRSPQGTDLAAWRIELQDRFPALRGPGTIARAFLLAQVTQLLGLTGSDVRALNENDVLRLEHAISSFDATSRRRLFHLAYERRHRILILDALATQGETTPPLPSEPPAAQVMLCIDERCESFRRHLEELGLGYETFGAAGFFAVPMYYRGLDDWHSSPLCPIAIRPAHTVVEVPEEESRADHARHVRRRRRYGRLAEGLSNSSRTLFRGGLFTALAGSVAAVPLVARVAFPRLSARLGNSAAAMARGRIATRLQLFREPGAVPLPDRTLPGFDLNEMTACVRRVLEDVGLARRFAGLVAVLGHGSSSRNNPHESAHDCGACGGGKGGPNARAFALMANHPGVRSQLADSGLPIPAETWFVGGALDTCSNAVDWFDLDQVPQTHRHQMQQLQEACHHARMRDAQERCRRFESAPLNISQHQALAHVEARSVDLAQVRPEFGHATNAVAVIGRRYRTRGLFLDRRAFLVSYDPTTDSDGAILARTLAAVGPVGAGINLEYYFSTIDPLGYGAGTKLPHNITGLIGVMDGHASDLRTGLPWQMVEIHEPVRLLIVVEASPPTILAAAEQAPAVKKLVVNGWVQLVSWHPDTGAITVFEDGRFRPHASESTVLPVVECSRDWYAGHRDHLPPARVLAGLTSLGRMPGEGTR